MQFEDAAKAVTRFAGGKKAAEPLRGVRLLPATPEGLPPRLYATNGVVGVYARVDGFDLPNALVPAEDLKPIGAEAVTGIFDEPTRLVVQTAAGLFALRKEDPNNYPLVPPVPHELHAVEEWPTIAKVLHAAADEVIGPKAIPGRPDLGCIHFYRDRVEATDSSRVAMADVLTPIQASVPAGAFKHLPKKAPVWATVQNGFVYFRVGEELRVIVGFHGRAPDCRQYVQNDHQGTYLVVPATKMRDAVKRAARVDGHVRLQFLESGVRVRGAARENEKAFQTEVWGEVASTDDVIAKPAMLMDGSKLLVALKAVDTPNVRLCYQVHENAPLRIESGGYMEAIWAMGE